MLTVVKRRRYLTPAEKQAEKKAEREGVLTHKVRCFYGSGRVDYFG
jgi:hypothetical protein